MTNPSFNGQFLGVLGGMGPLAGATFMARLTLLTPAVLDQDHIPAILWSDPRVPGRPAAYFGQGEDPFPWMINGVRHLEAAGAKAIVIPCNTAHLWFDQLVEQAHVSILHIVEAVVRDLQESGVRNGRIGVMATGATLQSDLYQAVLASEGYECIVPNAAEIAEYCSIPIELVKKNKLEEAYRALTPGIEALCKRGAQAIVLGCTELPLALPLVQRQEWGVPIVDSIDALARAALRWHGGSAKHRNE